MSDCSSRWSASPRFSPAVPILPLILLPCATSQVLHFPAQDLHWLLLQWIFLVLSLPLSSYTSLAFLVDRSQLLSFLGVFPGERGFLWAPAALVLRGRVGGLPLLVNPWGWERRGEMTPRQGPPVITLICCLVSPHLLPFLPLQVSHEPSPPSWGDPRTERASQSPNCCLCRGDGSLAESGSIKWNWIVRLLRLPWIKITHTRNTHTHLSNQQQQKCN